MAALGVAASSGAWASSTASSLAVDAVSTSFGVASAAISGSSRSVSPGKAHAAEGQHRVLEVMAAADGSGRATVQLEAPGLGDRWQLHLPQAVMAQQALVAGEVLVVKNQAWGFGVARSPQAAPFFLVLHDAWADGMTARPLR